MSDIREKIMASNGPEWMKDTDVFAFGFEKGLVAAADIAEVEVQRLKAKVRECGNQKELLLKFAKDILSRWSVDKYWDGEICEHCTDPERLVKEFQRVLGGE